MNTPTRNLQRRVDRGIRGRITFLAAAMFTVTLGGTFGYMLIEGWTFLESLYMTVISLSTVGFSEVKPLSEPGRFFTIGLIVLGVGAVAYLFGSVGEYLISEDIRGTFRKRAMQKQIDQLNDHYIVCGFGRVGAQVVEDLSHEEAQVLVIESDDQALDRIGSEVLYLVGDGAEDETLLQAGIKRARGLVAATGDDATNLMITLTARNLNSDLVIVARSNQPSTEPKMLQAGASQVMSPYLITGRRIATQLLHPSVISFLDVVMHSGDLELWLEEIAVKEDSEIVGKTLRELEVRGRTGVNVLAIRTEKEGRPILNPPTGTKLVEGSVLIGLGTREQLAELIKMAGDEQHTN